MDSLIAAAARALAAGDTIGALKHVALRNDPPALALRGIAMAQLGELVRARALLRRAHRGFGEHEELARARCIVAEAEVALAMRDFRDSPRSLVAAAAQLETRADRANALQARLIATRRLLLLGRLEQAAAEFVRIDVQGGPAALCVVSELVSAEMSLRSLHIRAARAALGRAQMAATRAQVPALQAEVREAQAALARPAARALHAGVPRTLRIDEVAALLDSDALIVDACRRDLRAGRTRLSLARRPVLFALLRALAQAWPGDVDREALIEHAFRVRRPDDTDRARLRVEIGRLRGLIASTARIGATPRGFLLEPCNGRSVCVLIPPFDGEEASLVALLADGAAWSTSALALALGASQRTVQRTLVELEQLGQVRSVGRARARRWLAPSLAGFATTLLLPAALAPE